MRQILQDLKAGKTLLADVPCPVPSAGQFLIQTRTSLVSIGTERMLVEFSQASLLQKARQQPDKVKQVLEKIRTDGLVPTLEAVFNRLDEPLPLGYCNTGVILDTGNRKPETGLRFGDRVVSNGPHAEMVCVPKNLCAKIPDGVSDEAASFTVLASIGLQGIRLAQPTLGERFVVYGLGLIGLLTVQLLQAHGCQVLGIDISPERLRLAESFGAETQDSSKADPVTAVNTWTHGHGADGVIITASAKTDEIVHQAAQMSRKRGRIVLVGVVGLNLRRSDFYEKELSFQVSCAYGPGRYDDNYEQRGQDYPRGFVRWTEQRNFEAVLDMLRLGKLNVEPLITHRVPFAEAPALYERLATDRSALGVILQYPKTVAHDRCIEIDTAKSAIRNPQSAITPVLGVIGAGNFTKMTLMPALSKTDARIAYVASQKGVSAQYLARKYGAERAVSDYQIVLQDPAVNAVIISVGHHLHARFVCEALKAGKHVFVEKPLAMNTDELRQIIEATNNPQYAIRNPQFSLMVGFNRRFSSHVVKLKQLLLGRTEPLAMNMTVNAGIIPAEHWVQDPFRGGGRIIGEACHFIDLMVFLTDSLIKTVSANMMSGGVTVKEDKMSICLGFEDGSIGTVNYFANGSKAYPKERLEVFTEGRVLELDNFRTLTGYGFRGFNRMKTWRQDKGHQAEFAAFVKHVERGGDPLIPLEELVNVTLTSFAVMTAANEIRIVSLEEEYGDF